MSKQDKLIDGNNFISHYLKLNAPCAVGKIGITELNIIYCNIMHGFPKNIIDDATNIAGIYPLEDFGKFTELYMRYLHSLDAMAIWNKVIPQLEMDICKRIDAYPISLTDIEPYFSDKPWSLKLENKRVLVISPFEDSIIKQYNIRDKIWTKKVLPDFELLTIKYPHAKTVDPSSPYNSTIEAINDTISKMDKLNYDVAIIGTGGSSIPLTAHAKSKDKIGIHMGGALQILFGIKGARWDNMPQFQPFFNEHWIRPSANEIPPKKELVEGGCYW